MVGFSSLLAELLSGVEDLTRLFYQIFQIRITFVECDGV